MEIIVFFSAIFLVFLYVMIRGAYEEKQRRKNYREHLRKSFGSFADKELNQDRLERIADRFRGQNAIDDITWNDLNMDSIFSMMDFAQSSSGEEYLYAMLRQPLLSDKDKRLEKMERHICYMMGHEEKRLDTMLCLNDLGTTGKYSLYDYMKYLEQLGRRSNLKHYVGIVLLVVSLALIFLNTSVGVMLLIAAACVNIVTYMREKNEAAPYVAGFAYIMRMMKCADGIIAAEYGSDMNDYISLLKERRAKLKAMERSSGMVMKLNSSTGNIGGLIFDYIKMLTHIDLIKFNSMLKLVSGNAEAIYGITDAIGYLDAVISIGYFRAALPHYCVPSLSEGKREPFIIKEGFHPVIKQPVLNSFAQGRGMLITGSNASGKSTFLKMTAINAILAQTIHTCAAREYNGNFYRIYSSMALCDNLDGGESYYIVEIKALKRIMDAAALESENPLLCFVDEVLRGTNTVERIAASAQILKRLSQKGIYCFAATHDIELTHLLEDSYDNFHFEEEVKDGDVLFSYHLLEGRAHTRNAIKLLEVMGFSEDIVKEADKMAAELAQYSPV